MGTRILKLRQELKCRGPGRQAADLSLYLYDMSFLPLLSVPIAILTHYLFPESHLATFILAGFGIMALAVWLGRATEHLAHHTGDAIGGLLNATLGNAAELIIGIVALSQGLTEVVKASLTGSIIGNLLLINGVAFCAGGMRFREQKFNADAARTQASMLTLAAIALIMPAVFHYTGAANLMARERSLSLDISFVLLLVYAGGLLFSLKTHRDLFAAKHSPERSTGEKAWSLTRSLTVLVIVTAFVAYLSEMLVSTVEPVAHSIGLNNVFVGVFIVAIVGNAAEHSTAILVALKNRMDLALSISLGSSTQIALFVAPALVILSHCIGPHPIDLVFSLVEVVAVFLSVIIAEQVAGDGKSNWFEGLQLLSVYAILGVVFFFL